MVVQGAIYIMDVLSSDCIAEIAEVEGGMVPMPLFLQAILFGKVCNAIRVVDGQIELLFVKTAFICEPTVRGLIADADTAHYKPLATCTASRPVLDVDACPTNKALWRRRWMDAGMRVTPPLLWGPATHHHFGGSTRATIATTLLCGGRLQQPPPEMWHAIIAFTVF